MKSQIRRIKQHTHNVVRGGRLRSRLAGLYGRATTECLVVDTLTDLMHLCDTMAVDFHDCLRRANNHHSAERSEANA
jgi:hypothetical protein